MLATADPEKPRWRYEIQRALSYVLCNIHANDPALIADAVKPVLIRDVRTGQLDVPNHPLAIAVLSVLVARVGSLCET